MEKEIAQFVEKVAQNGSRAQKYQSFSIKTHLESPNHNWGFAQSVNVAKNNFIILSPPFRETAAPSHIEPLVKL
jgi:hypothetical protein